MFSYISLQNVSVTLVVSVWPSATLWPLLWQRSLYYDNYGRFAILRVTTLVVMEELINFFHPWERLPTFAVRLVSGHCNLKKY